MHKADVRLATMLETTATHSASVLNARVHVHLQSIRQSACSDIMSGKRCILVSSVTSLATFCR
jgi:hypothetical protein